MTKSRLLWLILLVALALRLIFALAQDPRAPFLTGSADSGWYLDNAYALVTGRSPEGVVTDVSSLAPPPVYFIVIGVPQMFLARTDAVIAVRILQAILSTATCYFAYRLALRLTGNERAGLLAAGVLAVSPAFIIESAQILTETVFIFLATGGVWLYAEYVVSGVSAVGAHGRAPLLQTRSIWLLVLAAVLLGLATLTRAVLLAFPFGLALHLLLARGWRRGWRHAALLALVYTLVVSTWTIYSLARWNRFVIAGEGLSAFIYLGATGWTSPQAVDQALLQQSPDSSYAEAAQSVISSDPLGWIKHRLTELAEAYLQPHGTTFFPGESLRELGVKALRGETSLTALIEGDAFWSKLALYLFHYTALLAGLVGMWRYRRRWQIALPMIGFIGYATLVHLALYALPRYLFPAEVFWWVFAAAALQPLLASLTRRRA